MDQESIDQILDELFPNFEPLEARSAALLQLLKTKGLITDEELAPFFEQAANAASVRWLAVRVRVEALIASLLNPAEESSATATEKNADHASETGEAEPHEESPREKEREKKAEQKDESEPESPSRKSESVENVSNELASEDDVENAA
jgi:hypothetical protein